MLLDSVGGSAQHLQHEIKAKVVSSNADRTQLHLTWSSLTLAG